MGLIAAVGIVVLANFTLEGKPLAGYSSQTVAYLAAAWLGLWSLRSLAVSITATPTSLTRKGLFGECRIAWNEMESVEIGPFSMWRVFHGAGKRIWMRRPLSSIESWIKDDEDEEYEDPVLTHLLATAEAHGVPFTSGLLTPLKTSRA